MTTEEDRSYTVRKEEDKLIFVTPAFKTELDSVLHSGIYNREFASMLASAAVAGTIFVVIAMNTGNAIGAMVFLVAFAVSVPLFRKFVFKESLMEVVFNIAAGEARIFTTWIMKRLKETIALSSIKEISIDSRKREVENQDAVEFVKKISLQHGMVIPGFGRESVLFLLKLHLNDGSERTIYADTSMQDVMSAHAEIKEFLKI